MQSENKQAALSFKMPQTHASDAGANQRERARGLLWAELQYLWTDRAVLQMSRKFMHNKSKKGGTPKVASTKTFFPLKSGNV